eukprot:TRINITY_DN221_c0_g1_i1.p1 TRINITY_DN221_c0_g1~~TRINITY_DN221_c0_g1_i1.p1  ORF type:complete len:387 (-),score=64.94 TRINITY_DN221_c0_g1_i1:790-1950(-)
MAVQSRGIVHVDVLCKSTLPKFERVTPPSSAKGVIPSKALPAGFLSSKSVSWRNLHSSHSRFSSGDTALASVRAEPTLTKRGTGAGSFSTIDAKAGLPSVFENDVEDEEARSCSLNIGEDRGQLFYTLHDCTPECIKASTGEEDEQPNVGPSKEVAAASLGVMGQLVSANKGLKWLLPIQAQSSPPPPTQKQESAQKDDYYINVGYAVRTLREEIPYMFYKKLTFDIYRDDITLSDPLNQFTGIDNYKAIFWALRFHGRIFFRALWVDVHRIWQPCDKVIMVRWTVRGIPRVPWEAQGHFDGTSEYKLDKDGKIYAHKVDNVIMSSSRFQPIKVLDLVPCGSATPSFFDGIQSIISYMQVFTWVRLYCALRGTVLLNSAEKAVLRC